MTSKHTPEWRNDLAPGPDCVPLDRIGGQLSAHERAHLTQCSRCQAELAVWQALDAASGADDVAIADVASRVEQRIQRTLESNPSARGTTSVRRRAFAVPRWSGLAAGLVLLVAGALLWRDPSPDLGEAPSGAAIFRSGSVELRAPSGDLQGPPSSLTWLPVPEAATYDVLMTEVDNTAVWSDSTTATQIALPEEVQLRAVPSKTLQWQVTARSQSGTVIARSGVVRFRVRGEP